MLRQQRHSRDRRQVSIAQPYLPQLITWTISNVSGSYVQLNPQLPVASLILKQPPKIIAVNAGVQCDGMEVIAGEIRLHFPATLTLPETFNLAAIDGGISNSFGALLSPGWFPIAGACPPGPDFLAFEDWDPVSDGGTGVNIFPASGDVRTACSNWWWFTNTDFSVQPLSMTYNTSYVNLQFSVSISPGMTISYPAFDLYSYAALRMYTPQNKTVT